MVGAMCGRGACMAGGVHSRGSCLAGGMCDRGHACHTHLPGRYFEIWSMSGWYASYWNAFLFIFTAHNEVGAK